MRPDVDVLVIGAGQAGLAAGYWLRREGLAFVIVDGAGRVGDSWRRRWDSLTLFTPAAYSALPGVPVPGDPDAYPTKDGIADYLEGYARHERLPVRLGDGVVRLERGDGGFRARLASGATVDAQAVIVATGGFQQPAVPGFARGLAPSVVQHTTSTYRNPGMMPPGTVLVVGDGATGRQIALDLVGHRRVLLAAGRPRRAIPARVLGRSVFWWLDRLGILRAPRASRLGRLLQSRDPFPGRHLALDRLRAVGIVVTQRVAALAGAVATFADGSSEAVDAVVWATGYRDDTSWMAVDGALDENGSFVEAGGRSPVAGLYYVGRSWQRNRASALLAGVGDDARLIVDDVMRHMAPHHATSRPAPPDGRRSVARRPIG